jgi:hypothetical protein
MYELSLRQLRDCFEHKTTRMYLYCDGDTLSFKPMAALQLREINTLSYLLHENAHLCNARLERPLIVGSPYGWWWLAKSAHR